MEEASGEKAVPKVIAAAAMEEASGEKAVAKVIAAEVPQPSEPKEPKKKGAGPKDHHQQQPDGEGDAYTREKIARSYKNYGQKKEKPKDPNVNRMSGAQEVTEEEKQKMILEEYEKKLGNKESLEPSKPVERKIAPVRIEGARGKKKLEDGQRKAKEAAASEGNVRMITMEEIAMEKFGARMPISLDKIGVGDRRLHLNLKNIGVSLEPTCIHRKRLSIADRTMAKRTDGNSWQARHGVRFPLAKILTPEEEEQSLVALPVSVYDRSGSHFVVECKKMQGSPDSYRIISGWGDFLTRNNLVAQPDIELEEDAEPDEVVFEVWAFRSPALEVGVLMQPKDPLGFIIVHYRKGESPHGDFVIKELAAGIKLPDLDEMGVFELQSLCGFVKLIDCFRSGNVG